MRPLFAALFVLTTFQMAPAQTPAPAPSGPGVTLSLTSRQGQAVPQRQGFVHTGGGNIDVSQPSSDSFVVNMSGVAVAGAHPLKMSVATLNFELRQQFEVAFDKPETKRAKLSIEGRVIGLLRSNAKGGGSVQGGTACADVICGGVGILSLTMPLRSACGGENLAVNDREGPRGAIVAAGTYELHQTFAVSANHPHSLKLYKAVSAEFGPDPALDPLWISYWEPFHGAAKKDFGFQVVIKVGPDDSGK